MKKSPITSLLTLAAFGLISLTGCSSTPTDTGAEQKRQAEQIKQTEQGARDAQRRLDRQ